MAGLKVFRTPIGFHDAYVAAPSQKAALAAWGADADLFARGVAERVTDPELMAEPLEKPGEIVRRTRGSAAEHLAALPRERPRRPAAGKGAQSVGSRRRPEPPRTSRPKPKPRPSRAKLDALEKEMAALEAQQQHELRKLVAERERLERRKATIETSHENARAALQRKLDRAKQHHVRALEKWRAQP